MKYYIIAGEASGDLHGSNLIKGLKACDPEADFRFWGGDMMAEAGGLRPVRHYADTAVMGLTDVLGKAGKILGNLGFCKKDILAWKPDVVILIDYPGFNFKIAKFAHGRSFKVYYYIAPKTWASRESRNRKLRQCVDKLYIVFPFEIPYFQKAGVDFVYKGNPLLDAVDSHNYSPVSDTPYVALLPGSRKGEIKRMMPVCMEVADKLGCKVVVAGAPSRSAEDYAPYIGGRSNVELIFGRTYDILKYAESAIINSGTASLEAALIGTPQVVCWSTSPLTFFAAKHILKVQKHVKYISLANLILDKAVFKELIQDDFTADNVAAEVRALDTPARRNRMLDDYASIREALGASGASLAIAQSIYSSLLQA